MDERKLTVLAVVCLLLLGGEAAGLGLRRAAAKSPAGAWKSDFRLLPRRNLSESVRQQSADINTEKDLSEEAAKGTILSSSLPNTRMRLENQLINEKQRGILSSPVLHAEGTTEYNPIKEEPQDSALPSTLPSKGIEEKLITEATQDMGFSLTTPRDERKKTIQRWSIEEGLNTAKHHQQPSELAMPVGTSNDISIAHSKNQVIKNAAQETESLRPLNTRNIGTEKQIMTAVTPETESSTALPGPIFDSKRHLIREASAIAKRIKAALKTPEDFIKDNQQAAQSQTNKKDDEKHIIANATLLTMKLKTLLRGRIRNMNLTNPVTFRTSRNYVNGPSSSPVNFMIEKPRLNNTTKPPAFLNENTDWKNSAVNNNSMDQPHKTRISSAEDNKNLWLQNKPTIQKNWTIPSNYEIRTKQSPATFKTEPAMHESLNLSKEKPNHITNIPLRSQESIGDETDSSLISHTFNNKLKSTSFEWKQRGALPINDSDPVRSNIHIEDSSMESAKQEPNIASLESNRKIPNGDWTTINEFVNTTQKGSLSNYSGSKNSKILKKGNELTPIYNQHSTERMNTPIAGSQLNLPSSDWSNSQASERTQKAGPPNNYRSGWNENIPEEDIEVPQTHLESNKDKEKKTIETNESLLMNSPNIERDNTLHTSEIANRTGSRNFYSILHTNLPRFELNTSNTESKSMLRPGEPEAGGSQSWNVGNVDRLTLNSNHKPNSHDEKISIDEKGLLKWSMPSINSDPKPAYEKNPMDDKEWHRESPQQKKTDTTSNKNNFSVNRKQWHWNIPDSEKDISQNNKNERTWKSDEPKESSGPWSWKLQNGHVRPHTDREPNSDNGNVPYLENNLAQDNKTENELRAGTPNKDRGSWRWNLGNEGQVPLSTDHKSSTNNSNVPQKDIERGDLNFQGLENDLSQDNKTEDEPRADTPNKDSGSWRWNLENGGQVPLSTDHKSSTNNNNVPQKDIEKGDLNFQGLENDLSQDNKTEDEPRADTPNKDSGSWRWNLENGGQVPLSTDHKSSTNNNNVPQKDIERGDLNFQGLENDLSQDNKTEDEPRADTPNKDSGSWRWNLENGGQVPLSTDHKSSTNNNNVPQKDIERGDLNFQGLENDLSQDNKTEDELRAGTPNKDRGSWRWNLGNEGQVPLSTDHKSSTNNSNVPQEDIERGDLNFQGLENDLSQDNKTEDEPRAGTPNKDRGSWRWNLGNEGQVPLSTDHKSSTNNSNVPQEDIERGDLNFQGLENDLSQDNKTEDEPRADTPNKDSGSGRWNIENGSQVPLSTDYKSSTNNSNVPQKDIERGDLNFQGLENDLSQDNKTEDEPRADTPNKDSGSWRWNLGNGGQVPLSTDHKSSTNNSNVPQKDIERGDLNFQGLENDLSQDNKTEDEPRADTPNKDSGSWRWNLGNGVQVPLSTDHKSSTNNSNVPQKDIERGDLNFQGLENDLSQDNKTEDEPRAGTPNKDRGSWRWNLGNEGQVPLSTDHKSSTNNSNVPQEDIGMVDLNFQGLENDLSQDNKTEDELRADTPNKDSDSWRWNLGNGGQVLLSTDHKSSTNNSNVPQKDIERGDLNFQGLENDLSLDNKTEDEPRADTPNKDSDSWRWNLGNGGQIPISTDYKSSTNNSNVPQKDIERGDLNFQGVQNNNTQHSNDDDKLKSTILNERSGRLNWKSGNVGDLPANEKGKWHWNLPNLENDSSQYKNGDGKYKTAIPNEDSASWSWNRGNGGLISPNSSGSTSNNGNGPLDDEEKWHWNLPDLENNNWQQSNVDVKFRSTIPNENSGSWSWNRGNGGHVTPTSDSESTPNNDNVPLDDKGKWHWNLPDFENNNWQHSNGDGESRSTIPNKGSGSWSWNRESGGHLPPTSDSESTPNNENVQLDEKGKWHWNLPDLENDSSQYKDGDDKSRTAIPNEGSASWSWNRGNGGQVTPTSDSKSTPYNDNVQLDDKGKWLWGLPDLENNNWQHSNGDARSTIPNKGSVSWSWNRGNSGHLPPTGDSESTPNNDNVQLDEKGKWHWNIPDLENDSSQYKDRDDNSRTGIPNEGSASWSRNRGNGGHVPPISKSESTSNNENVPLNGKGKWLWNSPDLENDSSQYKDGDDKSRTAIPNEGSGSWSWNRGNGGQVTPTSDSESTPNNGNVQLDEKGKWHWNLPDSENKNWQHSNGDGESRSTIPNKGSGSWSWNRGNSGHLPPTSDSESTPNNDNVQLDEKGKWHWNLPDSENKNWQHSNGDGESRSTIPNKGSGSWSWNRGNSGHLPPTSDSESTPNNGNAQLVGKGKWHWNLPDLENDSSQYKDGDDKSRTAIPNEGSAIWSWNRGNGGQVTPTSDSESTPNNDNVPLDDKGKWHWNLPDLENNNWQHSNGDGESRSTIPNKSSGSWSWNRGNGGQVTPTSDSESTPNNGNTQLVEKGKWHWNLPDLENDSSQYKDGDDKSRTAIPNEGSAIWSWNRGNGGQVTSTSDSESTPNNDNVPLDDKGKWHWNLPDLENNNWQHSNGDGESRSTIPNKSSGSWSWNRGNGGQVTPTSDSESTPNNGNAQLVEKGKWHWNLPDLENDSSQYKDGDDKSRTAIPNEGSAIWSWNRGNGGQVTPTSDSESTPNNDNVPLDDKGKWHWNLPDLENNNWQHSNGDGESRSTIPNKSSGSWSWNRGNSGHLPPTSDSESTPNNDNVQLDEKGKWHRNIPDLENDSSQYKDGDDKSRTGIPNEGSASWSRNRGNGGHVPPTSKSESTSNNENVPLNGKGKWLWGLPDLEKDSSQYKDEDDKSRTAIPNEGSASWSWNRGNGGQVTPTSDSESTPNNDNVQLDDKGKWLWGLPDLENNNWQHSNGDSESRSTIPNKGSGSWSWNRGNGGQVTPTSDSESTPNNGNVQLDEKGKWHWNLPDSENKNWQHSNGDGKSRLTISNEGSGSWSWNRGSGGHLPPTSDSESTPNNDNVPLDDKGKWHSNLPDLENKNWQHSNGDGKSRTAIPNEGSASWSWNRGSGGHLPRTSGSESTPNNDNVPLGDKGKWHWNLPDLENDSSQYKDGDDKSRTAVKNEGSASWSWNRGIGSHLTPTSDSEPTSNNANVPIDDYGKWHWNSLPLENNIWQHSNGDGKLMSTIPNEGSGGWNWNMRNEGHVPPPGDLESTSMGSNLPLDDKGNWFWGLPFLGKDSPQHNNGDGKSRSSIPNEGSASWRWNLRNIGHVPPSSDRDSTSNYVNVPLNDKGNWHWDLPYLQIDTSQLSEFKSKPRSSTPNEGNDSWIWNLRNGGHVLPYTNLERNSSIIDIPLEDNEQWRLNYNFADGAMSSLPFNEGTAGDGASVNLERWPAAVRSELNPGYREGMRFRLSGVYEPGPSPRVVRLTALSLVGPGGAHREVPLDHPATRQLLGSDFGRALARYFNTTSPPSLESTPQTR